MAADTPTFCSPDELKALTKAFGSVATASAFCERLAPVATYDATASPGEEVTAVLADGMAGIIEGTNTFFLTIFGALVFIMHAGFAMLCAGAIRSKNTMNILLQTILDAGVSALCWYLIGYGIAYGNTLSGNGFIGTSTDGFAFYNWANTVGPSAATSRWSDWFFQWAFAATATTIPAGCVAERFNFNAYLAYTFLISAWVYPIVVHWVWSPTGWLSAFNPNAILGSGMIDFAGSAVVHMTGGFAGLMGCLFVGPRLGRFDSNGKPVDMPGHSATLVVLGTCLLWFGWYGFNPGSTLNVVPGSGLYLTSGRAAVTTTLSGAAGIMAALLIGFVRHRAWDLLAVCNGALVGFVAITAGASTLTPWASIIAGGVGVAIFEATCALWLKLRIDDPLAASPMHGVCGAWAVILVGLLADPQYVGEAVRTVRSADNGWEGMSYGAFYPGNGGGLFVNQLIGVLVIGAWVCFWSAGLFAILKACGILRISPEEEQAGLDVSKHGGSAYNYDHGLNKPEHVKI